MAKLSTCIMSINRLLRIEGHLKMQSGKLSSQAALQKKEVNVLDSKIAYFDTGELRQV